LALRIAEQKVPAKLFSAEVYLLDMTAIVAGTQFRGQFEGRIKAIIDEAKERGNVILVIDELHNIVGAGDLQGGAMNAANILKPALARGEVQIIGATTLEEYRKHIEKDAALERRFQPIVVDEPTPEESVEILKGIRNYYESYHRVNITDQVVEACVRLSDRYIRDRYLPDKAIDVMDEAGSRANLKNKGLVELAALRDDLEKVRQEKLQAAELEDYEKSADLKMAELSLEEKIEKLEQETTHVEIGIEDIAYVIEAWTKIPVQRITEDEADRLLILEERLKRRVIGQNPAVESLAKAVRRNRSGFRKMKKPSSFIFVGPTGVGKTELAKSLATELFGSDENMIRLDMSEYMERHTVSKLIGAPPGYVGFDQGGKLTDVVRRKPYTVILMDEIEKAHPDIFNILLQILDEGRLTDSQGRTVYFDNTVIIMTSNLGTSSGAARIGFGSGSSDAVKEKVREALRSTFRPEFLNRVDDIITFNKLGHDEFESILELMLKEVKTELHDKGMTMHVDDDAKVFLIEKGYSDEYGARPMRRAIQTYLEDEIAEAYLRGLIKEGDHLRISKAEEGLKVLPEAKSVEEMLQ
jgi:ATP-dependent Clp protease ATP-binding subunit ClpA